MGSCCSKQIKSKFKALPPNRRLTSHRLISKHISIQLSQGNISENYKILQNLAQNSQSQVNLALYKPTSSERVIKKISNSSGLKTSNLVEELNLLKNLDHPNIIKVYELIQDSESLNVVMEHCSGGELFDKLNLNSELSENLVANYMLDTISAIKYCHEAKIVHRDLKPENILFENDTKDARIKILDFGISQSYRNDKNLEGFLGSCCYVAPEAIDKEYTEKCDVWSLGVILYIMLSGNPPFYAKTAQEIFEQIKKAPIHFKGPLWDGISEEAKMLIKKMLRKDPTTRYSIYDVYSDPWIQNRSHNRVPDKPLCAESASNLKRFCSKTHLQRLISVYISKQSFTKAQLEKLKKKFESLDSHNNNKLTLKEIQSTYSSTCLNLNLNPSSIISTCSQNPEGKINYTEFLERALNTEKSLSVSLFLQSLNQFEAFSKMNKLELLTIIQETGIGDPDLSDLLGIVDSIEENGEIKGLVDKNNRV